MSPDTFIHQLIERGEVSVPAAKAGLDLWSLFDARSPTISATVDGGIGFTWDDGNLHLNILIHADGTYEVYLQ